MTNQANLCFLSNKVRFPIFVLLLGNSDNGGKGTIISRTSSTEEHLPTSLASTMKKFERKRRPQHKISTDNDVEVYNRNHHDHQPTISDSNHIEKVSPRDCAAKKSTRRQTPGRKRPIREVYITSPPEPDEVSDQSPSSQFASLPTDVQEATTPDARESRPTPTTNVRGSSHLRCFSAIAQDPLIDRHHRGPLLDRRPPTLTGRWHEYTFCNHQGSKTAPSKVHAYHQADKNDQKVWQEEGPPTYNTRFTRRRPHGTTQHHPISSDTHRGRSHMDDGDDMAIE